MSGNVSRVWRQHEECSEQKKMIMNSSAASECEFVASNTALRQIDAAYCNDTYRHAHDLHFLVV